MFRFQSPITMGNATASLAACTKAIDGGESELGLDALAHSDSSAVAVLLAALRHAQVAGRTLRISGMPASMHSLASLYGVDVLLGSQAAASTAVPGH